jgi:hypothetical protein
MDDFWLIFAGFRRNIVRLLHRHQAISKKGNGSTLGAKIKIKKEDHIGSTKLLKTDLKKAVILPSAKQKDTLDATSAGDAQYVQKQPTQ